MKDNKKQIFIAGLGRFGQSLAVNLLEQGAEVFGVDARESMVEEIADQLTHSAIANTTDPKVMARLGLADFDAAVCAIGSDLEASLMTTLLMKENGAKHIIAKSTTVLHGKILKKTGADRVIFPEAEVAARLARDFLAPKDFVEVVPLSVQYSMFELKAPKSYCGLTLNQLHLRRRFGLNVIALRRGEEIIVSPSAEEVVRRNDLMVVVGDRSKAREALEAPGLETEE